MNLFTTEKIYFLKFISAHFLEIILVPILTVEFNLNPSIFDFMQQEKKQLAQFN